MNDTMTVTTNEELERLIERAEYEQHPYGKSWQRFASATFSELVADIERRGLDQDILLYQGMILEGWHRYLACLATGTEPHFVVFTGTDLEAADKVHASGIRRHSTPEQRYAAFLMLGEACPEFKERYEHEKQKGSDQKKAGTPLSTDGQRVDVLKAKADAARVGRSTAAKVEQVKKANPNAIPEIAAGKTTANTELKKLKAETTAQPPGKSLETPDERDEEEGSNSIAKHPGDVPMVTIFSHIADLLTRCCNSMDRVDWEEESKAEWDTTIQTFSDAVESISAKADSYLSKVAEPESTIPPEQNANPLPTGTVSIRKLRNLYGPYAEQVLEDFLEEVENEKGGMRSYVIVTPLPTPGEFKQLENEMFTHSISDLVEMAFSEFEILASEVGDWYDSLPEGFQNGEKGCTLEETRGTLECVSQPDIAETLADLNALYLPHRNITSRAGRRDNAIGQLQAVVDVLRETTGQEAESLLEELEGVISEVECVDFPAMY